MRLADGTAAERSKYLCLVGSDDATSHLLHVQRAAAPRSVGQQVRMDGKEGRTVGLLRCLPMLHPARWPSSAAPRHAAHQTPAAPASHQQAQPPTVAASPSDGLTAAKQGCSAFTSCSSIASSISGQQHSGRLAIPDSTAARPLPTRACDAASAGSSAGGLDISSAAASGAPSRACSASKCAAHSARSELQVAAGSSERQQQRAHLHLYHTIWAAHLLGEEVLPPTPCLSAPSSTIAASVSACAWPTMMERHLN